MSSLPSLITEDRYEYATAKESVSAIFIVQGVILFEFTSLSVPRKGIKKARSSRISADNRIFRRAHVAVVTNSLVNVVTLIVVKSLRTNKRVSVNQDRTETSSRCTENVTYRFPFYVVYYSRCVIHIETLYRCIPRFANNVAVLTRDVES